MKTQGMLVYGTAKECSRKCKNPHIKYKTSCENIEQEESGAWVPGVNL